MIYIVLDNQKALKKKKTQLTILPSKLKKIQGLPAKMEFKDFSRTSPKIQGLFKTERTVG